MIIRQNQDSQDYRIFKIIAMQAEATSIV